MNESELLQSLLNRFDSLSDLRDYEFVAEFELYEKRMGIDRKKKDLVLSSLDYNDLIYYNLDPLK